LYSHNAGENRAWLCGYFVGCAACSLLCLMQNALWGIAN
jgi:hypothetical protein